MTESTATGRPALAQWLLAQWPILRDASVITGITSVVALGINAFHPEAIPYIAPEEYEVLVPCPEPGGATSPLAADDPELAAATTFIIDARSPEEFDVFHFSTAVNVTFDYLEATPPEVLDDIAKRIARSKAQRVAVYGDGEDPDTGQELAKEIAGSGVKNVFFIQGGAPALRARVGAGGAP